MFEEKFLSLLKKDLQKGASAERLEHLKCLIKSLQKVVGEEIYITSFCKQPKDFYTQENGLLSQWRGYGCHGAAAIILNQEDLQNRTEEEGKFYHYPFLGLKEIVYAFGESEIHEGFHKEIKELIDIGNKFIDAASSRDQKKLNEITYSTYNPYLTAMTSCKHPSFHEENEVRIIARPIRHDSKLRKAAKESCTPLDPDQEKEIHFRSNGHIQIPYIKLFENLEENLPIERIIIGPQKDQKKQARSLRILLENLGLDPDKVTCSETPYTGA